MDKNDQMIDQLRQNIEKREKAINNKSKALTTTLFITIQDKQVNLRTLNMVKLIDLSMYLRAFQMECNKHKVPAELNNELVSDWLKDVAELIKQLQNKVLKAELKAMKDTLNDLVSDEKRRTDQINDIASKLGK